MMVVMAAAAVAGEVVAVAAVATTAVPAAACVVSAAVVTAVTDRHNLPPFINGLFHGGERGDHGALGAGAARGSPWRPLTLKLVWRRCDRPPRAADVPVAPHAAAKSHAVLLAGRLPGEMASPWAPWQRDGILRSKLRFPFHSLYLNKIIDHALDEHRTIPRVGGRAATNAPRQGGVLIWAQGARAGDSLFLSVEQPGRLDYAVNR